MNLIESILKICNHNLSDNITVSQLKQILELLENDNKGDYAICVGDRGCEYPIWGRDILQMIEDDCFIQDDSIVNLSQSI